MNLLVIVLLIITVIILLSISNQTYVNENYKNYIRENFDIASAIDMSQGSSGLYNWGYRPIERRKDPKENCYDDKDKEKCRDKCRDEDKNRDCRDCDITRNKDIDKYVLKSSIPPCPDMSNFAKKSQMSPNIDLSQYVLKSEIKPCPKSDVDLKDYIKKSEIPACPQIPLCPRCPIAPVMPDLSKYMLKSECKREEKEIRREDRDRNRREYNKDWNIDDWRRDVDKMKKDDEEYRKRIDNEKRMDKLITSYDNKDVSRNKWTYTSGQDKECPDFVKYQQSKPGYPKPFSDNNYSPFY